MTAAPTSIARVTSTVNSTLPRRRGRRSSSGGTDCGSDGPTDDARPPRFRSSSVNGSAYRGGDPGQRRAGSGVVG